ncbi:ABC transporter permease [Candidatus Poribacteria bacterium]|nr:ABC transporter permease [Candidatus Poribacteria bacterium]
MIIPKLALRNLLGAGLRTWLNVVVLSFSFVAIIWMQGIYRGMNDQVEQATMDALYGGGQYWHEKYDPYDPLSLADAHGVIPEALQNRVEKNEATPILIRQGTLYPNGRIRTATLKGIDPKQTILTIPAYLLKSEDDTIPALIGSRMAKSTGLKKGDDVTVQWRDANGTFDAREVKIVEVMKTSVQEIDNGQLWIPLYRLQNMTAMPNEATMVVLSKESHTAQNVSGWAFKDLGFLLQDLRAMVQTKTIGASILYFILLFLAMLAIFNTQLLSIFRRKKEMGTLMALGMTRVKVIELFTLEGAMHGVLAALVAAVYGIPLLVYTAHKGWALPESTDSYGIAIGEKIFPTYSAGLVLGTTLLVLVVTTIVSYLPTRRIAKLKPTDALRGKLS